MEQLKVKGIGNCWSCGVSSVIYLGRAPRSSAVVDEHASTTTEALIIFCELAIAGHGLVLAAYFAFSVGVNVMSRENYQQISLSAKLSFSSSSISETSPAPLILDGRSQR